MRNLSIILTTAILTLLSACSHPPSAGEVILNHAKENQTMGEKWVTGEKFIEDGNAMQEKGKKLVSQGESDINKGGKQVSDGVDKVEKGLSLQKESENQFENQFKENI